MFISAIAVFGQRSQLRHATNLQANSMSMLLAVLLLFTVSAWGQGDSDYLKAMDKASGKKEQNSPAATTDPVDQKEKFVQSDTSFELESLLSQNYPEEFAIYKKLDAARKNEVIAAFESTQGKAENIQMMRVINKIGLMGDSGGWNY